MRAELRDKTVCEKCHGTGVEIVNANGRYSYARNCEHIPQQELPLDVPLEAEQEAA